MGKRKKHLLSGLNLTPKTEKHSNVYIPSYQEVVEEKREVDNNEK